MSRFYDAFIEFNVSAIYPNPFAVFPHNSSMESVLHKQILTSDQKVKNDSFNSKSSYITCSPLRLYDMDIRRSISLSKGIIREKDTCFIMKGFKRKPLTATTRPRTMDFQYGRRTPYHCVATGLHCKRAVYSVNPRNTLSPIVTSIAVTTRLHYTKSTLGSPSSKKSQMLLCPHHRVFTAMETVLTRFFNWE